MIILSGIWHLPRIGHGRLCVSVSLSVCGGGALSEPLLERVMQQLLTTLGDRAANASQVRIK